MSRILIVDDDEHLSRSIARLLQREGHECVFADHIRSVLQDGGQFDLVLIELQASWLGKVEELRARLGLVPFVFTTGRRELFRTLGEMLAPGDDLLTKPFDAEELVARTELALRRSGDATRAGRSVA
jgi:DNA-binding response OmpR family regulator